MQSIIFSIDLFPIAATAIFLFRLTKSRKTFYAQIECLCFHTTSTQSSRSAPSAAAPAVAPEPTLLFIANADLTG